MSPTPPRCPNCPDSVLWKDTSRTARGDRCWHWWCSRCRHIFEPSETHLEMFTYGTPGRSGGAVFRDPRMPGV